MAREPQHNSDDRPEPDAVSEVRHDAPAPSGDLIVRGRTVIDPTEAHDLEVRGVAVIDKGRRSYRNKLINRGRTVIDERSSQ